MATRMLVHSLVLSYCMLIALFQSWLLAHRVHLHNALKEKAIEKNGLGLPVELHTSRRVEHADVKAAKISFRDGTSVSGDLILGADGVHSVMRKEVITRQTKPYGSGKSAFRFLISKKLVLEDPAISKLFDRVGELIIWYHIDRRIVVYPTTNNELLNFVCIHPEEESEAGESWNTSGHLDCLLKIYQDFEPAALALIGKADPATLKTWKLLDMEVLPTWINEKLALLGDAAHPFLPHQGQGGACAIEDAATLAVVLPGETPKDEIVDRLKLYQDIRYERANKLQEYSRLAGADFKDGAKMDSTFTSARELYQIGFVFLTEYSAGIHQLQPLATTSGTTLRTSFENGPGRETR